ncbi:MAG: hypothetical protein JOZ54_25330 [Acidobacteria bacterium]|nr:hypothetical protein [Acidobacteriota bacterium]
MRLRALAVLCFAVAIHGQTSEADRVLDLRRAELNLRQAQATMDRQHTLATQGLASKSEVDRVDAEFERARIEVEKARVLLSNELPSFRIVSAVKSIEQGMRSRVTLTLQPLARGYAAGTRRSYLVSIKGGDAIVGTPYQQEVVVNDDDRPITVKFSLLREADEVTVLIVSGTRHEEVPILLQRASGSGLIRVSCSNYSQEAIAGGRVEYPLTLERFDIGTRTLGIRAAGLPSGFTAAWLDAESKAAMTGLRFGETENQRKLVLEVYLPQQASGEWLDRLLPFRVDVTSEDGAVVGSAELQLQPRAAPKLFLTESNLLVEVAPRETVTMPITIENNGGAEAREVIFDTTAPIGLSVEFQPTTVATVRPRQPFAARMRITAAPDAVPGDYTLRVKVRTQSRLLTIESPEQTFRVTVRNRIFGAWAMLPGGALAILVLVGGGAWLFARRNG